MADASPKTNIRDRGVLANLLDFNKMRDDSAEVGNAFFNKSTEHNGPSDAMRHVIFNAKLTTGTGSRFIPWLLDKLHEYGETAAGQPRAEMEMDLANGELGREIGKLGLSDAEMVDLAQRAVQGGKAVYMTKPPQKTDYATGGEVDTEPTDLEQAVQEQFGLEPNLDRAALLPYKSKDKGWIAPEALYQAAKLVASPITALHGKYISPEEAVEGALTLGSPSTAAGLVSKAEPGVARMFIGNRSNAWDEKAHALALKMEDEGASPRTIWEQTMNWRTPEGRWVQEVSDKGASYDPAQALQNAKLQYKQELQKVKNYTQPYQDALRVNELFKGLLDTTPNPFHEVYAEPHPRAGEVIYHPSTGMPMVKAGAEQQVEEFKQALKQQAMQQFEQESGAPLSKEAETHFRTTPAWQLKTAARRTPASFGVTRPSERSMQGLTMERALEAPETYAAYPGLRRYPFAVKPESKMGGANASFQPTTGLVSLSAAAEEPTASLLHELQHAVQHREGLEGGANPKQFKGLRSDVAHQLYLRNLGEGMARATAARKDLTMAQRNAIFPAESFSLPNVSPSTTMEQFMWEGMDPAKKSLILKYIKNNIDDLTGYGSSTGNKVDIPLAYDPDKVGSIVDSLHAEMAAPEPKFAEGGEVSLPPVPTLNDAPTEYHQRKDTLSDKLTDLSIGLGEGLTNQLKGYSELIEHPIDTGKAMYQGLKAVINDPSVIKDALQSIATKATESPVGLGTVIGENISPTGLAKRLAGVGKPVLKELTVYHGSPHTFEPTPNNPLGEFTASKIGTGEGAQSYGHGIYVAENPAVAKDYQFMEKNWFDTDEATYNGKSIQHWYDQAQKDQERAHRLNNKAMINDANARLAFWEDIMTHTHPEKVVNTMRSPEYDWPEAAKFAKTIKLDKFKGIPEPGNLYTVDLPDEHIARMLDWDKPLSEQHPDVQAALENSKNKQIRAMLEYAKTPYSSAGIENEAKTMGEAYRVLSMNLSGRANADSAKASQLLQKSGIPGIKYLDAGSREAGEGTRNFVMFPGEEHNLKILERKAKGGLVAQPSSIEYDPSKVQSIVDQLRQEIHA